MVFTYEQVTEWENLVTIFCTASEWMDNPSTEPVRHMEIDQVDEFGTFSSRNNSCIK